MGYLDELSGNDITPSSGGYLSELGASPTPVAKPDPVAQAVAATPIPSAPTAPATFPKFSDFVSSSVTHGVAQSTKPTVSVPQNTFLPPEESLSHSDQGIVGKTFDYLHNFITEDSSDQSAVNSIVQKQVVDNNLIDIAKKLGIDKSFNTVTPSGESPDGVTKLPATDALTHQSQNDKALADYMRKNYDQIRTQAPTLPEHVEELGPTYADVRKNIDKYTKDMGVRNTPTNMEIVSTALTVPVTAAFIEAPVAAAIGLAAFSAMGAVEHALLGDTVANKVSDALDLNNGARDALNIAELFAQGKILHVAYLKAPEVATNWTKNIITKYELGDTVFLDPAKIRAVFTEGVARGEISKDELDLVKALGLDAQGYKDALKNGVTVQAPSYKVINLVDKPYWAKIKDTFNVGSAPEEISRQQLTETKKGAEQRSNRLLGAKTQAGADILKNEIVEEIKNGGVPAAVEKLVEGHGVEPAQAQLAVSEVLAERSPDILEARETFTPPDGVETKSVTQLSVAKNSLALNKSTEKPGAIERAKKEIQSGNMPPVRIRTLEDGKTFIEDGRHHLEAARQLGMEKYPVEDVTAQYVSEKAETPQKAPKENAMLSLSDRAASLHAELQKHIPATQYENILSETGGAGYSGTKSTNAHFAEKSGKLRAEKVAKLLGVKPSTVENTLSSPERHHFGKNFDLKNVYDLRHVTKEDIRHMLEYEENPRINEKKLTAKEKAELKDLRKDVRSEIKIIRDRAEKKLEEFLLAHESPLNASNPEEPKKPTVEPEKKEPLITDPHQIQEIRNSIDEGKNLLRTGKDTLGEPLTPERRSTIRQSILNAQARIGEGLKTKQDYTVEDVTPAGYGPDESATASHNGSLGVKGKEQFKREHNTVVNENFKKHLNALQDVKKDTDVNNPHTVGVIPKLDEKVLLTRYIYEKVLAQHGAFPEKDFVVTVNDPDFVIEFPDHHKVNLFRKEDGHLLVVGGNETTDGYFTVTFISTEKQNYLTSKMKQGNIVYQSGRTPIPSSATPPKVEQASRGVVELSSVGDSSTNVSLEKENVNKPHIDGKPNPDYVEAKTKELQAAYRKTPTSSVPGFTKADEELATLTQEMELAEAGQRSGYGENTGQGWENVNTSTKSTFPDWIPEHLRSRALFDKVYPSLEVGKLEYPTGNRSAQRELYDAVLDQLDGMLGIDTRAIRNNILKAYEPTRKSAPETPDRESPPSGERPTGQGETGAGRPETPRTAESQIKLTSGQGTEKQEVKVVSEKEHPQEPPKPPTDEGRTKKGGNHHKDAKSRVYERLQAENPELGEEVTYDRVKMEQDAERAVSLVETDAQKAYQIAMGTEESSDVTSASVSIALADKALADGNNTLFAQLTKVRSLAQTRRGQEINAEKGSVSDNSTAKYVKELVATRLEILGSSYLSNLKEAVKGKSKKQRAVDRIDAEVKKVQKKIKGSKEMDLAEAQKLIDSLMCK